MHRYAVALVAMLSLAAAAPAHKQGASFVTLPLRHARPSDVTRTPRQELRWHSSVIDYTESDWSRLLPGVDGIIAVDAEKALLVRGTTQGVVRLRGRLASLDTALRPPALQLQMRAVPQWRGDRSGQDDGGRAVRLPSIAQDVFTRSGESTLLYLEHVPIAGPYSGPGVPVSHVEVLPRVQEGGSVSLLCLLKLRDPDAPSTTHRSGEYSSELLWQRKDNLQPGQKAVFVLVPKDRRLGRVLVEVTAQRVKTTPSRP